jgi:hypothetical protein
MIEKERKGERERVRRSRVAPGQAFRRVVKRGGRRVSGVLSAEF